MSNSFFNQTHHAMRNCFLFFTVAALILSGCTNELPGPDPNAVQDVVFTSTVLGGGGMLKTDDPFSCDNPPADYAMIVIEAGGETTTHYSDVFYLDGKLYTQALKLAPGQYQVVEFVLMHEQGDPNDLEDDMVVNAAPHEGTTYGDMLDNPLPVFFSVFPFEKSEIPIEILCFEEAAYLEFGFTWFRIKEFVARTIWFFGDFCTKNYAQYAGSAYDDFLGVDMPAIFQLKLYHNGNVYIYGNAGNENMPTGVQYIDRPDVVDQYTLELYILVKVGLNFEYVLFDTWNFEDDDVLTTQLGEGPGEDGVYDFVLGNCNAELADFAYAPYMNLPVGATLKVNIPGEPRDAYMDVLLSNIGSGYDIANGTIDGFCFERGVTIYLNQLYNVDVYSTLNPALLPANIQGFEWDRVNWLVNHLEDFPGYTWYDLQHALWKLQDPSWNGQQVDNPGDVTYVPEWTSVGEEMYEAAVLNGDGFIPLPGGYAAVTFVNQGNVIQTVFIIVDP